MDDVQTIPPPPGYKINTYSGDSDLPQPIASVRTGVTSASTAKVGDVVDLGGGQSGYVNGYEKSGRPTLAPIPPPPSGYSINKPPMTTGEAGAFMDKTTSMPWASGVAPGSTSAVKPQPKFSDEMLVDPQSSAFGGGIPSSVHPDTRGGRNLVPVQNVAAAREQAQYEAAHPDEMAQVQHSQAMDTSLPLAQRLAARAGLEARTRTELGQAVSNVNDQWKNYAGGKGADAGEAAVRFAARNFQDDSTATPGEIGVARSVGKNVASTLADPVTYAVPTLGATGKIGQVALSSLFAAGAARQSYDTAGQLGSIWDREDIPEQQKAEMASDLFINTAMAGLAGAHAVKVPFVRSADPLLDKIPQEYKDAVAQKINTALKSTGGVISRAASAAGDVAAEVGNSDRENVPTQGVTAIRKALPKIPIASAEKALPLVRAAADDLGMKTVSTNDLLNSEPDKNGNTTLGLIGLIKNDLLTKADAMAGPGKTISDLTPEQMRPIQAQLDALDDLHDHLEDAQDQETAELKAAADKGKIPATKTAALLRMGMGAGKVSLSAAAGSVLGRMSRVLLHAYGIPSGFNDLVTGVKGIIGAGGKISPTLDDNLNLALGRTQPDTSASGTQFPSETREAAPPYQGDLSVQHDSVIAPPELPHGDARMVPDVPSRFQVSSGTTNPVPRTDGVPSIARNPMRPDAPIQTSTSYPAGVTPQVEPRQIELNPFRQSPPAEVATARPAGAPARGAEDVGMPRGEHPEEIVQNALMKLDIASLREVARAGDIDYNSSDTNQSLIGKIMEAYAGQDEHLADLAETLQGKRGEVKPGPRQPAPIQDEDLTDVMQRSVEAANARNAGVPTTEGGRQVTVNVNGESRTVSLTPDKSQQWEDAQARYQQKVQLADQVFQSTGDAQQHSADLKAAGMQWAGEKRQISGVLTGKESAAAAQREASNYRGKSVSVNGQNGTVTGTSFGKIRVQTDAGIISANPEDIQQPLAPEAQQTAAGFTEKRQPGNETFRDSLKGMSDADKNAALEQYHIRERTSAKTGLPNELAFNESASTLGQSHPHVGWADADDFKTMNDTFDHKYVDQKVLRPVGELIAQAVAQENGAIHAFHISGDEFAFRANDPAAVTRVIQFVNDQMGMAKFELQKPDGTIVTQEGIGLSHGTGATREEAELASMANKGERKAAGLRTGIRDAAQNQNPATSGTAQGNQNPFSNTSERQGVLDRGINLPAPEPPAPEIAQIARPNGKQAGLTMPPPALPPEAPMAQIARPQPPREQPAPPARPAPTAGLFGATEPTHAAPSGKAGLTPDNPLIDPSQLSPGEAGYVKTEDLHLAPKELQYKLDTDESGVTSSLKDTRQWNPDMAGVLSVWQNPKDGLTYVVNGHHRYELAGRLGQDTLLVRQIAANTIQEARATGALINISEGRGTAIDAAKFFRDSGATPEALKSLGVSMVESKVSDGFAMSRLDPSIFDRVVNREIPENQAVAIGTATDSGAQQEAILKGIEKAANKGKALTLGQVESLARRVVGSDVRVEEGQDLFGAFQREHSNFVEEARIDDAIRNQFKSEISTFKGVSSETKAQALGAVQGQSIKPADNAAIADAARQDLALYDKLSKSRGPVDDIVKSAAKRLAYGDAKPADIVKKAFAQVREETSKYRGGQ